MFNGNKEDASMTTLKKSLQTLGSIAAVGGMLAAAPLPADERDQPDYGHFHLFVGPQGVPASSRHAKVRNLAASASDKDAPSHLIAISMTPAGMPERLFTTNGWVTGETWYRAADVIGMLDLFVIELDHPSRPL